LITIKKKKKRKDNVVLGNEVSLSITYIGTSHSFSDLPLLDVLAAPHLTKNLLSIIKLTFDSPLKVMFIDTSFVVQNCITRKVVATKKCNGAWSLCIKA